jgi:hemerythrin superfamily protein
MTDFLTLLRRDHHDLEVGLDELLEAVSLAQLRSALDGVRLGLTAHAEAEDIVLYQALQRIEDREALESYVGQAREAHLAQEGALASLVCARPGTSTWRERARFLRNLVRDHAFFEEQTVVPAIRRHAPEVYDSLAGEFATERLRQLAQLQPSAPIAIAELARAS